MNTEIELKLRVTDRPSLVGRLAELNAEPLGRVITSDVFLDTEGDFLYTEDRGLRLRDERYPDSSSNSRTILTYKGPRAPGPIKRREEIQLALSDLGAALELFGRLGYTQKLRFEKERRSWRLGGCVVDLDRVPCIGDFVEVEGPDEERIRAVQHSLHLDDATPVAESYAALIAQYLQQHNSSERVVLLAPEEGAE